VSGSAGASGPAGVGTSGRGRSPGSCTRPGRWRAPLAHRSGPTCFGWSSSCSTRRPAPGELLRLAIGDYDPRDRTILVRESKFHKSRVLPLSSDAVRELETYLPARRRRHLPVSTELPLLWNGYDGGRAYSGHGLGEGFGLLLRAARIRPPDGRRPRIHDVRHSFARARPPALVPRR
jgi:integrase